MPMLPTYDPMDLEPEEFRALIYEHPNSERIRWWRATPDPTWDRPHAQADTLDGGGKWIRTEQIKATQYRAIVEDARIQKRFLQMGELLSGDIVVSVMPDEMLLSDHDWIVPIGRVDPPLAAVDGRTFVYKEAITRGSVVIAQAGLITAAGTAITGAGTHFKSLNVGDYLLAANQSARILSIASDTACTVDVAPAPAWASNKFSRACEQLKWDTAMQVLTCVDATGASYAPAIAGDQMTLVWPVPAASPAIGTVLGVTYRYYPKYVVLPDQGLQRHVVSGVPTPLTVVCRLWNPQTHRRP